MTEYTADDFAQAEFARHPGGRIAARVDSTSMPWRTSDRQPQDWMRDDEMAAQGWSPVRECPNPDVHDRETHHGGLSASEWKILAETYGRDLDRLRDDIELAEEFSALWKETARALYRAREGALRIHQEEYQDRLATLRRAKKAEAERDEARVRGGEHLIRAEKAEDMRDRWKATANSADDVIRAVLRELGAGPETEPVMKAKAVREARDAWRKVAKRKNAAEPRPLAPEDITADAYERGVPRLRATLDYDMSALMAHEVVKDIVAAVLTEPPARPEGAEDMDEHMRQANSAALGGLLTPEQRQALADHLAGFGYRTEGSGR